MFIRRCCTHTLARKRHLLEPFKRKWEPLAYKFESQSTAPWPEVRRLMQVDIESPQPTAMPT